MQEKENIAATLSQILPKAEVVATMDVPGLVGDKLLHIALPGNTKLQTIDLQNLLPRPRRAEGVAAFSDLDSFVDFVAQFARSGTTVWCDVDPVKGHLSFEAVIDDHEPGAAGWRKHRASFVPRPSVQWLTWSKASGVEKSQMEFATFIEHNEKDIYSALGYPSSLEMMSMATNFEANADRRLKSRIRLQSGGVELHYVSTDDDATVERMRMFERFKIGIPVFWEYRGLGEEDKILAYEIEARLRYKTVSGEPKFWFELIRPDIVHERASAALISRVRGRIPMDVPLFFGRFQ